MNIMFGSFTCNVGAGAAWVGLEILNAEIVIGGVLAGALYQLFVVRGRQASAAMAGCYGICSEKSVNEEDESERFQVRHLRSENREWRLRDEGQKTMKRGLRN